MVKVMRSMVRGPLAPYAAGFAAELLRQGYTAGQGLGLEHLSNSTIERYLVERRAAGYVEYRSTLAMRPLLAFLTPMGVLPSEPSIRLNPEEELVGRYRSYLLTERGLTPATVAGRLRLAAAHADCGRKEAREPGRHTGRRAGRC